MHGFWLLIPFFFIRFTMLSHINQRAVQRAAHFAPRRGMEQCAYVIYQISNVIIFLYLCFLTIRIEFDWYFSVGIIAYVAGLFLCARTMVAFAKPDNSGLNTNGIYRYSRNPMYVAYFIYFVGCVFLTKSFLLGVIVLIFQISAHWIILSEERECIEKFQDDYRNYMKKVRRYI